MANVGITVGKRERGIAQRRKLLIATARELISEREDGTFSMNELANRAALSLATPYNLFGSKAHVLECVLQEQMEAFNRRRKRTDPQSPVASLMAVADQLIAEFSKNPRFYKNIFREMATLRPTELGQFDSVNRSMLAPLVQELYLTKVFCEEVPPRLVRFQLELCFNAVFFRWIGLDFGMDRFRSELRVSFALTFKGVLQNVHLAEVDSIIAVEAQLI